MIPTVIDYFTDSFAFSEKSIIFAEKLGLWQQENTL